MKNLFIIGSPRSGTTFLSSLLAPTKFGAPFETHFIVKYLLKINTYGILNNTKNLKRLINDISNERAVKQWQENISLEDIPDTSRIDHIFNSICLKLSSKHNKPYWGDKTPHYVEHICLLEKNFPDAKFIYIVRDGRDVAMSLLKKPWGPNNIYTCALLWKKQNNKSITNTVELLEKNKKLLKIKYEDLLDNTHSILEKTYSFLDEDINLYSTDVENLKSTTLKENFFKWKKKMTHRDALIFQNICLEELKHNNYETTQERIKLNILTKILYLTHDKALYSYHFFKMNIIDGIKIKFFNKQPFNE